MCFEYTISIQSLSEVPKDFWDLREKMEWFDHRVLLNEGPQRFKEIAQKVEKCSDRVLVERLKELEKEGLVERVMTSNSSRAVYQLTDRGAALKTIMQEIHVWSEKWYSEEDCK